MIGSLDCRQWRWYNCPTAWRGQNTRGDQKGPTLVLQVVASYGLWVWSTFIGVAGCMNDINTFECSPLLESYISGTIPKAGFHVNGNDYEHDTIWAMDRIRMLMYACSIMHNMIIEDDGKTICQNYFSEDVVEGTQATIEEIILNAQLLRSKDIHNALKADLVEHTRVICPIRYDGDVEEDYEEEEVEEFEAEIFADGGRTYTPSIDLYEADRWLVA
ncbi:uncharacterized protein LOC110907183 [Helianthus annuus]|uniref:uncharacterized protein LOC110907183 n=1 Tax=Helianthus annuus TaxID=4232 RepID=UPI000B903A99|nr:uncharacterized protein LOC110907183 [Helianthus annuus]